MSMKPALICLTSALLALAVPLAPAQTKIIDLSPTALDCSGQIFASTPTNGKLYNCQSASPALRDAVSGTTFTLPAGTTTAFSSNPVSASATPGVLWFILPQTASIRLTGLAAVPLSNTTIKIRTIAQMIPHEGYQSILSMTPPSGYSTASMFSIGQNSSSWVYGRLFDKAANNVAYWMTPWDPTDPYSYLNYIYEDVYYTFTQDARLRIDMLTPYLNSSGTISYVWEESVQDGGWPLNTLGQNVNAQSDSGIFLPSGNLVLGSEYGYNSAPSSFGTNDPTTIPSGTQTRITGITVYSQPLSVNAMLADANTDFPSASLSTSNGQIYPCNTGYWLGINQSTSGIATTPCGTNQKYASPVPSRPSSVTPLDNFNAHAPSGVQINSVTSTSVSVSWSAPPTKVSPSAYTVWAVGENTISTGVTSGSTATLTGLNPNSSYQIYVIAVFGTGIPYSDTTSLPISVKLEPLQPTTNLTSSNIGVTTFTLSWTDPNQGPALPVVYNVLVDGVPKCSVTTNLQAPITTCNVINAAAGATHSVAVREQIQGSAAYFTSSPINVALHGAVGIEPDGVPFSSTLSLDGNGHALSLNAVEAALAINPLPHADPADLWSVVPRGQPVSLPQGKYSLISLMGVAAGTGGSSYPTQTFTVHYTNNTSQTFTQGVSDWSSPQGYPNEFVAVKTFYRNNANGTKDTSKSFYVYQYTFAINANLTLQDIVLPINTSLSFFDIVPYNNFVSVDLSSAANALGIVSDGTPFGGGLDGNGYAYSTLQMGTYAMFNGTWLYYGPTSTNNAMLAEGQTIPLPQGKYVALNIIATAVNSEQQNQQFIVDYASGRSRAYFLSLNSWNAETYTPQEGESVVLTTPYRNISNGAIDAHRYNVYGYTLLLSDWDTIKDIRFPNNSNVAILAMNLTQIMTLTTSGWTSGADVMGIVTDNTKFASNAGIDGSGHAFSMAQLTPSLGFTPTPPSFAGQPRWWNGIPFTLLPTNQINVFGSLINIPGLNSYSYLYILGTSVNGTQANRNIQVCYSDGTCDFPSPSPRTFTDWYNGGSYSYVPGENRTAIMSYRDQYNGTADNRKFNVYVYVLPLKPNKAPVRMSVSNDDNNNFKILSYTLQQ